MNTAVHMRKILTILLGNTLYALAVVLFILPNGLITGGTTGLALVFQHQFGIPVSVFVGVFNVLMFLIGAFVLGKTFALTTVLSTFYYPFILGVFQTNIGHIRLTEDTMLAMVFAGILIGAGIGLVIKAGASTGGMDIPPLVLNKKLGLSVSGTMSVLDTLILVTQMLFASVEQILYGVLLVFLYTTVLDKMLMLGKNQVQMKIMSEKSEAISEAIRTKLDRGTTLLHSEGGHMRKASYAVLTVVSSRELSKVNDLVMALDANAFIVINQVKEVRGRGFTLTKKYE